jgi:hypothetical protein
MHPKVRVPSPKEARVHDVLERQHVALDERRERHGAKEIGWCQGKCRHEV